MTVWISRRYHLSASHRLHAAAYTNEQNRHIFGKCNNPYGHGHNYIVQITMYGPVDEATGMVVNLADLDAFAGKYLIEPFDHQNLNRLTPFMDTVPSTENLAIEIYRIFQNFPHAQLAHVRIEETGNNSFEYAGQ